MEDWVRLSVSAQRNIADCPLDQFLRAYGANTLDEAIKAFVKFIRFGVENAQYTGMIWTDVLIIVYNKKRIRRIAHGRIGYSTPASQDKIGMQLEKFVKSKPSNKERKARYYYERRQRRKANEPFRVMQKLVTKFLKK